MTTPTQAAASKAVAEIVKSISDRKGLRQVWDSIDDDVKAEIEAEWTRIICNEFAP